MATQNEETRAVFVIEDEADMRELLVDLLSREGYEVHAAGDGVEALRGLPASGARVLLVDLGMPRLDGEQLLRGLKGLSWRPRVLVVSGHDDGAVISKRLGADGFLAKPFVPDALLAHVARLSNRGTIH